MAILEYIYNKLDISGFQWIMIVDDDSLVRSVFMTLGTSSAWNISMYKYAHAMAVMSATSFTTPTEPGDFVLHCFCSSIDFHTSFLQVDSRNVLLDKELLQYLLYPVVSFIVTGLIILFCKHWQNWSDC